MSDQAISEAIQVVVIVPTIFAAIRFFNFTITIEPVVYVSTKTNVANLLTVAVIECYPWHDRNTKCTNGQFTFLQLPACIDEGNTSSSFLSNSIVFEHEVVPATSTP